MAAYDAVDLPGCAEEVNEALGPLDRARRSIQELIIVAQATGDPVDGLREAERLAEHVQSLAAELRAKFDDLAEQLGA
jgi:hypothetical protein